MEQQVRSHDASATEMQIFRQRTADHVIAEELESWYAPMAWMKSAPAPRRR